MANFTTTKKKYITKPPITVRLKLFALHLLLVTLRPLALLIISTTPYIAIVADRAAFRQRGYFAFGGELLVPLFCMAILVVIICVHRWLVQNIRGIVKTVLLGHTGRRRSGYAK